MPGELAHHDLILVVDDDVADGALGLVARYQRALVERGCTAALCQ